MLCGCLGAYTHLFLRLKAEAGREPAVGDTVRLDGLVKARQYNGLTGTVVGTQLVPPATTQTPPRHPMTLPGPHLFGTHRTGG